MKKILLTLAAVAFAVPALALAADAGLASTEFS